MRKRTLLVLLAILALTSCGRVGGASVRPLPTARHADTQWIVRDSVVFDAITFVNALRGDPLVGSHYLPDTRHFRSLLTPEVEQALADLAVFHEEKHHGNLSGFLLSFFLAGNMEQEGFPQQGESYQDFVIRSVAEKKLAPGKTEALYRAQLD